MAKDASGTANGAVGNLAQTGKTTAGAIKRGDVKGVGTGLAKGTGATVGAAGQGVRTSFPLRSLELTGDSQAGATVSGAGKGLDSTV